MQNRSLPKYLFCFFALLFFLGYLFAVNPKFVVSAFLPDPPTYPNDDKDKLLIDDFYSQVKRINFYGISFIIASVTGCIYLYLMGNTPVNWFMFRLKFLLPKAIRERIISNPYSPVPEEGLEIQDPEDTLKPENSNDKVGGRLLREIAMTRKNSNVNLAIGIFTTAIAVYILGSTIVTIGEGKRLTDIPDYIPRITLSFFIELFSFFFLRLYRKNLDDIKYLTNEITNMEAKAMALEFIKNNDDKVLQKAVIGEIVKTERNFILNKGQSTVELEKSKIEKENYLEAFNKMFSFLAKQNTTNQK